MHHEPVHFEQPRATWRPSLSTVSTESSDEKDRQRQAARESHKKLSLVIARRGALKDMAMDLEKRGSRVLPALATALARPSASSSRRRTCRPRRRNRLRLPEPRCSGDYQHPCPSPSRLSGLLGVHGALGGDAAAAATNYQNGFSMSCIQPGKGRGFKASHRDRRGVAKLSTRANQMCVPY